MKVRFLVSEFRTAECFWASGWAKKRGRLIEGTAATQMVPTHAILTAVPEGAQGYTLKVR